MTDKCCKTCKHWDRNQAKNKAGRISPYMEKIARYMKNYEKQTR